MQPLKEQLTAGDKRQKVVDDALLVLDQEVSDKGGIAGMAIRGGYKLVQSIRPGFLRQVVEHLLDDFLGALDPIYAEAAEQKRPAGAYLIEHKSRVAEGLLQVTDRKAERAQSSTIQAAYKKLRPLAQKQVEAATPRLAGLLERHAAATG